MNYKTIQKILNIVIWWDFHLNRSPMFVSLNKSRVTTSVVKLDSSRPIKTRVVPRKWTVVSWRPSHLLKRNPSTEQKSISLPSGTRRSKSKRSSDCDPTVTRSQGSCLTICKMTGFVSDYGQVQVLHTFMQSKELHSRRQCNVSRTGYHSTTPTHPIFKYVWNVIIYKDNVNCNVTWNNMNIENN